MKKYKIWKDEYGEIMVEIYENYFIESVQKEFIEKGYIIISVCIGAFGDRTFMVVEEARKLKNEW